MYSLLAIPYIHIFPIGYPLMGIDWGRDTAKRLYKAPTDYTKTQKY